LPRRSRTKANTTAPLMNRHFLLFESYGMRFRLDWMGANFILVSNTLLKYKNIYLVIKKKYLLSNLFLLKTNIYFKSNHVVIIFNVFFLVFFFVKFYHL